MQILWMLPRSWNAIGKKADKVGGTSIGHIKNRKVFSNSRSGVRGVSWDTRSRKWRASIKFQGKQKYLGLYEDINDAEAARKKAEEEIFGGFLDSMEEQRKVTDLIKDALKEDDYKFRINFIVAGLISAESNDTAKKQERNNGMLAEICGFARSYTGEEEKEVFMQRIRETIEKYLQDTAGQGTRENGR